MNSYSDFFSDLNSTKSVNDILGLFSKYNIERNDRVKYPYIEFSITDGEIEILKKNGIITKNNMFDQYLSKNKNLSSLEKLLYSILWKQGDLKKEKHIISGIYGIETNRKVFNQFGKHLRDKYEPIIDQHVIRSFIFFTTKEIVDVIKDKHFNDYSNKYIEWIKSNNLFNSNQILIDELLFLLGRKLKIIGKNNSKGGTSHNKR